MQRDEATEGLQECMMKLKTANRQYLNERSLHANAVEKLNALEKELTDVKSSKEYALNAVLDALQQEKDRSAKLEKLLGDSSTASYYYERNNGKPSYSSSPPGGVTAVTPPGTMTGIESSAVSEPVSVGSPESVASQAHSVSSGKTLGLFQA